MPKENVLGVQVGPGQHRDSDDVGGAFWQSEENKDPQNTPYQYDCLV